MIGRMRTSPTRYYGRAADEHSREKPKRVPVQAFVDREQAEDAERLAKREDRSVSSIVRQALRGYLERAHERSETAA